MPLIIFMAFIWAPPAEFLGEASRILYFHVPVAWVSVISFVVAGVYSIIILVKKDEAKSYISYNSALIGLIFTVLTILTGSIWAHISWGSYWNWDPRETSIAILLLIYIAYFSLHSSLEENPNRDRIGSVYLIMAMAVMPLFVFIIPRVYPTLHPDPVINADKKIHLELAMKITLFSSIGVFSLLYLYIMNIMNRISLIKIKIEEKYYDK